jgi:KaiC domain protein
VSGDDDWFEEAIDGEEDEAEDQGTETDEATDGPFGDDGSTAESSDTGGPFGDDGGDENPFGGADDDSGDGGPFGDADDSDSDGPFEDTADSGGDGPFGGGSDDGAFGGGGDEDLFEEGFSSAFDSGGDDEFDDEDFDSDIPRLDLGIEGLDNMVQGGIPQKHLIVTIGSAGTGKTTFGLQFLHHGLENGENSVFITLEQSKEAIMATANERGWEFDRYEEEDRLAVVDLDPVEMANSLDNIRGELPELIRDFDADRLVLDSVSLLEMMYDNQANRRTEVFDFTRSLKQSGVTTFLTSEASESNPYASRHGIIEYLTDAVFILQYVRSETRETRLAVEIQKIRNANHSREKKPYEITNQGISVYQQANIF